jgi:hypothetical protein
MPLFDYCLQASLKQGCVIFFVFDLGLVAPGFFHYLDIAFHLRLIGAKGSKSKKGAV